MGDQDPKKGLSAATLSVWGGEEQSLVQGATQVPVVYSAAYGYPDVDTWLGVALGRRPGHIYSRNTNPTVEAFETKVRLLKGAQAAASFATGMAAISNTLLTLLSPGDRIVSVKDSSEGRTSSSWNSCPASASRRTSATRPTTSRSRPPSQKRSGRIRNRSPHRTASRFSGCSPTASAA